MASTGGDERCGLQVRLADGDGATVLTQRFHGAIAAEHVPHVERRGRQRVLDRIDGCCASVLRMCRRSRRLKSLSWAVGGEVSAELSSQPV